jgi:hypothetical protein
MKLGKLYEIWSNAQSLYSELLGLNFGQTTIYRLWKLMWQRQEKIVEQNALAKIACHNGRGRNFWQEHMRCLAAIGVTHCCYF